MVQIIDPAYYSLRMKSAGKLPQGVTADKEYIVIGYITDATDKNQFISHWIVSGDHGGPVYVWPISCELLPNLPSGSSS